MEDGLGHVQIGQFAKRLMGAEAQPGQIVEHNLEVGKTADRIPDPGREGGDAGSRIAGGGTPEAVAAVRGSHTGEYVRLALASARKRLRA